LGAWGSFASKFSLLHLSKCNDTVNGSVNSEVAADVCTRTCNFSAASLADENFASADFLATKTLNTEALTCIVVDVFAGSASFNV
jgi:hypothetical protein